MATVKPSAKAEEIIDAAEAMIRKHGYNGFSFREIADVVGIKSASVHYHFPSKSDLSAAVAERYTERFLAPLGDPEAGEPQALVARYVAAYREALVGDELMCLCGMLGAEIGTLPAEVARATKSFFEANITWLTRVFRRLGAASEGARRQALATIATLEGAMILARSLDEPGAFDDAVAGLLGDAA